METGELIGEPLTGYDDFLTSVAISPNDKWIFSGSYEGTVRIWELSIEEKLDYVRKKYPPLNDAEKRQYGM